MASKVLRLLVMLLPLVRLALGQTDPIGNCKIDPDETDWTYTTLCSDRERICEALDLEVVYDLDSYCEDGQLALWHPNYQCNCMPHCIDLLEEDEECQNTFTSSFPSTLCGVGLDCMPRSTGFGNICSRNPAKPCVNESIAYETAKDEGTLGPGLRYPECDDLGLYGGRQCSASSTCYCVDEDGNRLHGEALYTEKDEMDCECALHWKRNADQGLEVGFRCLANGNLDSLQCNEDFCLCYNSTLGQLTQGPYAPESMILLDCYDPTYHRANYTNVCTQAYQRYLEENPETGDEIGIGSSQKPNCSHDGMYAAVQPKGLTFYCSNPYGQQIEDFTFGRTEQPSTTCYCATRRYLLQEAGFTSFLPACCPNGNYQPYQTRGVYAYCVDINGDQQGETVSLTAVHLLPCYEEC